MLVGVLLAAELLAMLLILEASSLLLTAKLELLTRVSELCVVTVELVFPLLPPLQPTPTASANAEVDSKRVEIDTSSNFLYILLDSIAG